MSIITSSWADPWGGVHQNVLHFSCSNITFVGTGKDTTTILGGFAIYNFENITFKNMTVTNTSGRGIIMKNAKVELVDVALKRCRSACLRIHILISSSETTLVATRCEFANSGVGVFVTGSSNSATFNNCVFHDNRFHGIQGENRATIHLHGEATAVHSNENRGISTYSSAKVLIHLPSHHNTSYNNGDEDRYTSAGGTITNVEE